MNRRSLLKWLGLAPAAPVVASAATPGVVSAYHPKDDFRSWKDDQGQCRGCKDNVAHFHEEVWQQKWFDVVTQEEKTSYTTSRTMVWPDWDKVEVDLGETVIWDPVKLPQKKPED